MQVNIEFVIYDEVLDKFEIDENVYAIELNDEQMKTYNLLKDNDLHLYNWLQKSDFFLNWVKEEIYPECSDKKIAISVVDDIMFLRYYFFKVTSGDIHYEYFIKLFDIHHESDWQDREEVGEEIIEHLLVKRKELIIDLKNDTNIELNENNSEMVE